MTSGSSRYDACGCGGRKTVAARRCRACAGQGRLVAAVAEHYPEVSARELAERLGTTEMAVYNTASRLRRLRPGSLGYRPTAQRTHREA